MSSDYMDLVLCEIKGVEHPVLFRAPAFTHMNKGDRVIVEEFGGAEATVLGIMTVDIISEKNNFDFILTACGATAPLGKVLSKLFVRDLEYEDEGGEDEEKGLDPKT